MNTQYTTYKPLWQRILGSLPKEKKKNSDIAAELMRIFNISKEQKTFEEMQKVVKNPGDYELFYHDKQRFVYASRDRDGRFGVRMVDVDSDTIEVKKGRLHLPDSFSIESFISFVGEESKENRAFSIEAIRDLSMYQADLVEENASQLLVNNCEVLIGPSNCNNAVIVWVKNRLGNINSSEIAISDGELVFEETRIRSTWRNFEDLLLRIGVRSTNALCEDKGFVDHNKKLECRLMHAQKKYPVTLHAFTISDQGCCFYIAKNLKITGYNVSFSVRTGKFEFDSKYSKKVNTPYDVLEGISIFQAEAWIRSATEIVTPKYIAEAKFFSQDMSKEEAEDELRDRPAGAYRIFPSEEEKGEFELMVKGIGSTVQCFSLEDIYSKDGFEDLIFENAISATGSHFVSGYQKTLTKMLEKMRTKLPGLKEDIVVINYKNHEKCYLGVQNRDRGTEFFPVSFSGITNGLFTLKIKGKRIKCHSVEKLLNIYCKDGYISFRKAKELMKELKA